MLWPPPLIIELFFFKKSIISTALIPLILLIDPFTLFSFKLITILGILYFLVSLLAIIPIIPGCQLVSCKSINLLFKLLSDNFLK